MIVLTTWIPYCLAILGIRISHVSSHGDDFERVSRYPRGLQHHPHPSWMLSIQKIGQPPLDIFEGCPNPGRAMSVQIIQRLTDIDRWIFWNFMVSFGNPPFCYNVNKPPYWERGIENNQSKNPSEACDEFCRPHQWMTQIPWTWGRWASPSHHLFGGMVTGHWSPKMAGLWHCLVLPMWCLKLACVWPVYIVVYTKDFTQPATTKGQPWDPRWGWDLPGARRKGPVFFRAIQCSSQKPQEKGDGWSPTVQQSCCIFFVGYFRFMARFV